MTALKYIAEGIGIFILFLVVCAGGLLWQTRDGKWNQ